MATPLYRYIAVFSKWKFQVHSNCCSEFSVSRSRFRGQSPKEKKISESDGGTVIQKLPNLGITGIPQGLNFVLRQRGKFLRFLSNATPLNAAFMTTMLEIACFNADSALTAAQAGADRIELCADYDSGGVTPSLSSLQSIRGVYPNIPVNVMIRPRAGDFVYTDAEFEQMKSEILEFKPHVSGFVFGILDKDSRVDLRRNQELVQLAGLPCTFHRAFDQVDDKSYAAEQVIECGFASVLTSGGEKDALSGAEIIATLHQKFGAKVAFIAGGGVRSSNLKSLQDKTTVRWFHSAAITENTGGEHVDKGEVVRLKSILFGASSAP